MVQTLRAMGGAESEAGWAVCIRSLWPIVWHPGVWPIISRHVTVVSEKLGVAPVVLDRERAQRYNLRCNSIQSGAPDLWRWLLWTINRGGYVKATASVNNY